MAPVEVHGVRDDQLPLLLVPRRHVLDAHARAQPHSSLGDLGQVDLRELGQPAAEVAQSSLHELLTLNRN